MDNLEFSPTSPDSPDTRGHANKALKRRENDEQHMQDHDWISALPDEMLIYVLTLMPMKDAAIMGCVSTRWRHLWRHIPNLMLNEHSVGMQQPQNPDPQTLSWFQLQDTRAAEFIVKVNSILRQRHGTRIELFIVNFPLNSRHAPEVDRWVARAAECGVKRLKLKLAQPAVHNEEPYDFPLQCFASGRGSSLRDLILQNCELSCSPKRLEGFRSLKYLVLNQVSVADVDVTSILSTCSGLALFQLKNCIELVHLTVCHAQLCQFYVENCPNLETVSIHAKKLYEFAYMGHMADMVYSSAPVLRKVRIQFTICSRMTGNECPLDCIGTLPSLRMLHLQFTSPSMHSLALQHYQTFAGLKEVMLSFLTPWNESILLVAYFLIATPLLARLQLEAYGTLQHPKNMSIAWPEHVSLGRLQRVIIGGFSGESELMGLASFLLRRSPALNMLKVYTHPLEYRGGQKWYREVAEDPIRCYYAMGVAFTHLAPKVPSTVKFTVE